MRTEVPLILLMLCLGMLAGCGRPSAGAAPPASDQTSSAGGVIQAGEAMDAANDALDDMAADEKSNRDRVQAKAPPMDDMLVPLTQGDIRFYLTVMRAAAERVRHPTPEDLDAVRQAASHDAAENAVANANASNAAARYAISAKFRSRLDAAAKAAASSGDMSAVMAIAAEERKAESAYPLRTVPPLDAAVADRATTLRSGNADLQIVAEQHLDGARYSRVKDVIQVLDPPAPGGPAIDGECDDCGPKSAAERVAYAKFEAHAKKVNATMARDRKTLAPYAAEIGSLQRVVRNGPQ